MGGFALFDPLTGAADPLRVGRNWIGRRAAAPDGSAAFIAMDSARAAVSRRQAVIDLAASGDAWLMDTQSANGTFLSLAPGAGLRLEAGRFYQLPAGARIVFGDVERRFGARSCASTPYLSPGDSPPRAKRARSPEEAPPEPTPVPVPTPEPSPPRSIAICYSGMNAEEREQAERRAAQRGAKSTETILDADVLVVRAPITRTPKFIIAVARGIPIAAEDFLECADMTVAEKYVPSLRHGSHLYSAAALRKVIFRKDRTPPLAGKLFSVGGLPAKSRTVAREIILGCGGEVPRRQSKEVVALTEKNIDKLYDDLLRGKFSSGKKNGISGKELSWSLPMKRLRSLLDVAGAPDGLPEPRAPSDNSTNSRAPSDNSRSGCRPSAERMDSQRSAESAFSTEIGFFSREEDSAADMCLFLARAFARARTPAALAALVDFFARSGAAAALAALKRAGQQPELLRHLCAAAAEEREGEGEREREEKELCAADSRELRRLLLRVVALVARHSDAEARGEEAAVRALLRSCRAAGNAKERREEKTREKTHWSQRGRPAQGRPPAPRDLSELTKKVNELCGNEDAAESDSIALRILLDVVFAQNGKAVLPSEKNMALVFADAGGFETLEPMLRLPGAVRADALHLLEAVTLCVDLCKEHKSQLRGMASALVELIVNANGATESVKDEQAAALRVLTNVTGLLPSALAADAAKSGALARWIGVSITESEMERSDTLTFALCCATNVIKWEGREARGEFTDAVVASVPKFLARVARRTFDAYHAGETEMHVLAGYYALLLAVISLCESPGLELRVPVMTAVANATHGTTEGKKAEAKPMTLIVAILQEFLLFQSSAGSLTKDTLIEMNEIIERVLVHNRIEVSAED